MSQSFPTFHLSELASSSLTELDGKTFFVEEAGFRYPVRLKLLEGADKLFIMLKGAVGKTKTTLPVFARWNWGKILNGHVLSVCDPTLDFDEKLRVGWYLGNPENHAIPGVVSLAKTVGASLGVAASHQIYYGSSGGGFAAIVAAGLSEQNGNAIAINPQIDLFAYHLHLVQLLEGIFGSYDSIIMASHMFPERWNAMSAIIKGREAGYQPRVVIAQNTVDTLHYEKHYLPFVEAFGVPIDGGVDSGSHMLSMVYTSPEGHGAEPPELVRRINEEAIPFLCSQAGELACKSLT